jgi:hypothetical protein
MGKRNRSAVGWFWSGCTSRSLRATAERRGDVNGRIPSPHDSDPSRGTPPAKVACFYAAAVVATPSSRTCTMVAPLSAASMAMPIG